MDRTCFESNLIELKVLGSFKPFRIQICLGSGITYLICTDTVRIDGI